MTGHPMMHWIEDGRSFYSREHDLPDRPYLAPATDFAIASGVITDAYVRRVLEAILEVTG
jgi:hypothetical protein